MDVIIMLFCTKKTKACIVSLKNLELVREGTSAEIQFSWFPLSSLCDIGRRRTSETTWKARRVRIQGLYSERPWSNWWTHMIKPIYLSLQFPFTVQDMMLSISIVYFLPRRECLGTPSPHPNQTNTTPLHNPLCSKTKARILAGKWHIIPPWLHCY